MAKIWGYNSRGIKSGVEYIDDITDLLHNDAGPALIRWHINGRRALESYYIKGKQHRLGGPAETMYWSDGTVKNELFYNNGIRVQDYSDLPKI